MEYKVGDIVKLSTGEKGTITKTWGRYSATIEDDDYDEYNFDEKEIIGLWEERKSTEQAEDSSVNSSVKKYKLIDILNKIANGELKEGTKVVWKSKECWGDIEYTYKDGDLEREVCGETIYVYEEMFSRHLKDEVELIEPEHFREDTKMIEPTDNTKIEELEYDETDFECLGIHSATIFLSIQDKLNEVIRILNKRG